MVAKRVLSKITRSVPIDWPLLAFLILFVDVKLVIKAAAVILIYAFRFNIRFGVTLRQSRLPPFYPLILCIGLLNYFLTAGFLRLNYSVTFIAGTGIWLLAFLAIHQIRLSTEKYPARVVENTVSAFLFINAACSFLTFLVIMWQTGTLNPFLYQGDHQKYFMGTGDYIKGVSFDTSTTNAIFNAFGVLFFLERKKPLGAWLCMTILLLTGSNMANIFLAIALIMSFIFHCDKHQKSIVLLCFYLLTVFITKVSPQNNQYVIHLLDHLALPAATVTGNTTGNMRPVTTKGTDPGVARQKIAQAYLDSLFAARAAFSGTSHESHRAPYVLPSDNLNGPSFQYQSRPTPEKTKMTAFILAHQSLLPLSSGRKNAGKTPGKLVAWEQTFVFLSTHPQKWLTGTGIGNFASKTAFKATALGIAGAWPAPFQYINSAFLQNHLDVYLDFFTRPDGFHSVINSPASVYDQLLSEYGLAGLAAYFFGYLGFFIRRSTPKGYKMALTFLLSAFFLSGYWFEQLSIVVLFELLQFINPTKESANE